MQTLVLGWLAHPDVTLDQLLQTAARVGVEVRPQAIGQRLNTATAQLLKHVLVSSFDRLIAADPIAIPIRQWFTGVFVHESTTIVLPNGLKTVWQGCAGTSETNTQAARNCGVQLALLTGALSGLDLAAGRASDQHLPIQHRLLSKGSLRLADLGFYDVNVFVRLSAQGVYFLSKLEPTAVIGHTPHKQELVLRFVERLGAVREWAGEVYVGAKQHLSARLLVKRVPQEVADARRRRIRKTARDKGVTPSAAALALAAWTLLLTNAPAELLRVEEALVGAKVRWQIELLFKLWKSHGRSDERRSENEQRRAREVYAKLLAMVIQHWGIVVGCWQYAERSLVKAAQVVRDQAGALAWARGRLAPLVEARETIARILKRTAQMNARRKHPTTHQLLLALTT